ncbi:MAG: GTPase Era [Bdellovibrionales bacterium]|nr:GTPase Era [Bdellovibrionales bacterium]
MSYHAGFVGLIGLPNSGKSTLMNALVGEKVSIVTAKPQTTRRRVIGIVTREDMQAVFVDAPGLVQAKSGLNQFLRDEAHDVITQSDVLIAVLNVDEKSLEHLDEMLKLVRESGKPWIALIHKTDLPLLHRPQILRERLSDSGVQVVQGSAMTEPDSIRESILAAIKPLLPVATAPLYDQELYTLSPTRELCAEIVREKCFETLHQEVPFGLAVRIMRFDEESDALVKIIAEIMVAKENHRPIVIGKGGSVLKKIGTEARKEMEKLLGRKVYLDLNVTSKTNWQKNTGMMKDLGYVVPKA